METAASEPTILLAKFWRATDINELTVFHVQAPSVPYYRWLYDSVGEDYHWLSRRKLSDEALAAVIRDSRNELHVLHVDGSPAGFAELDRRSGG